MFTLLLGIVLIGFVVVLIKKDYSSDDFDLFGRIFIALTISSILVVGGYEVAKGILELIK